MAANPFRSCSMPELARQWGRPLWFVASLLLSDADDKKRASAPQLKVVRTRGNMQRLQSALAVLCVINLVGPVSVAQDRTPTIEPPHGILHRYEPTHTPPVDLSNSSRLDQLLRAGNLYLSLQDAIALALENNLDIARARYSPLIAQTDVQRAQAAGALRGVNTQVSAGPASAGGGLSLNAFSNGSPPRGPSASSASAAGGRAGTRSITHYAPNIPTS